MSKTQQKYTIKLRKGDIVMVRAGRDKGKTGKVSVVHPSLNKVTVDGINVVKKHVKPNREHPKGAIVEKTVPIWVGKVGIVHSAGTKQKTSRIGYKLTKAGGTKTRVLRQAGNKEIK